MTDRDSPSLESSRELRDIFVEITGESGTTDQQDEEAERGKKVLNRTDSEPTDGEE